MSLMQIVPTNALGRGAVTNNQTPIHSLSLGLLQSLHFLHCRHFELVDQSGGGGEPNAALLSAGCHTQFGQQVCLTVPQSPIRTIGSARSM